MYTYKLLVYSIQLGPVNTANISCSEIQNGKSNYTRSLTISWATTEDFPNKTSHYVIVLQEEAGAEIEYKVEPKSSDFTNKQRTIEVKLGTEYQIKVRTNNCEGRLEGENATTTVLLNGIRMCFYFCNIHVHKVLYFFTVPPSPCVGNCIRRVDRDAKLYALDITIDKIVSLIA